MVMVGGNVLVALESVALRSVSQVIRPSDSFKLKICMGSVRG